MSNIDGSPQILESLISIIQLQTDIIDKLALDLMQFKAIEEMELELLKHASMLQKDARDKGILPEE